MNIRDLYNSSSLITSFTIVCIILLSGCSTGMQTRAEHNKQSILAGTKWRLVQFESSSDEVGVLTPTDPSLYTMNFMEDGRVAMRLNCNRASGSWSAEPVEGGQSGSLRFGPLAGTRALCVPPSMDSRIVNDSSYVRSYLVKDGKLHLSLMADGGIYTWEQMPKQTDQKPASAKYPPAAPEEGGPRNWQVEASSAPLRQQASSAAPVLSSFRSGDLLDNLGCKLVGTDYWCDVQQLGGGPRGFVHYSFLKPAVSPDGSVPSGPDDSALRMGRGEFDASSTVPCAQKAGQAMARCGLQVARAGGGYATVKITKPDGGSRIIYFRLGRPIGASSSQAEGYADFKATKQNDVNIIQYGVERYEVPDAVVLGG